AEDFLLRDAHVAVNVVEYRRRYEVSAVASVVADALAALNQAGPFVLPGFHVAQHGFQLSFVDRRADIRRWIQSIADDQRRRSRGKPLDEVVRDRFDDNRAAGGRASLSGRP